MMMMMMDSSNMKVMYTTFIRSILEYGNVLYLGAKPTHLHKLDAIQASAQRLGQFEVESLESRRKAAAIRLALRMLDGDCKPGLLEFAPELIDGDCVNHTYSTKHKKLRNSSLQLNPLVLHKYPLDSFKDSFLGAMPSIWSELPPELVIFGRQNGWKCIIAKCKRFFKNLHK